MAERLAQPHVSLVAVPDVMIATLAGLHDAFTCSGALGWFDRNLACHPPFDVDVVAPEAGLVPTASGLALPSTRALRDVQRTDVVIAPSLQVAGGEWVQGRYPELVAWLRKMHGRGADLCSACSGTLLMAETGLLDGREATMHWAYADTFRRNFPAVRLREDRALITEGDRNEIVMSGAASSWNDLALYLIARYLGPPAAQAVAKFFAFQWHTDGMAPYAVFMPRFDHGDAIVLEAQRWIGDHLDATNPVDAIVRRAGVAERSFKRRFKSATGRSPLRYVQALRVEEAKRRLEASASPVEEVALAVGYENAAFFRRLFQRTTGVTPGAYRRMMRVPDFAALSTRPA